MVYDTEGIWRGEIKLKLNRGLFRLCALLFLTSLDMIEERGAQDRSSGEVSRWEGRMVVRVRDEGGPFRENIRSNAYKRPKWIRSLVLVLCVFTTLSLVCVILLHSLEY